MRACRARGGRGVAEIDLMVLSHSDADHLGAVDKILQPYMDRLKSPEHGARLVSPKGPTRLR